MKLNKSFNWQDKNYIFWDFDGVIKESVELKSNAYEQLFLEFGSDVSDKIRDQLAALGVELKDGKDGTTFSLN